MTYQAARSISQAGKLGHDFMRHLVFRRGTKTNGDWAVTQHPYQKNLALGTAQKQLGSFRHPRVGGDPESSVKQLDSRLRGKDGDVQVRKLLLSHSLGISPPNVESIAVLVTINHLGSSVILMGGLYVHHQFLRSGSTKGAPSALLERFLVGEQPHTRPLSCLVKPHLMGGDDPNRYRFRRGTTSLGPLPPTKIRLTKY